MPRTYVSLYILTYFNLILYYELHGLLIAIIYGHDIPIPIIQTNNLPFSLTVRGNETVYAIATMRSDKHLDVQFLRKREDYVPQLILYSIMKPCLKLIQQEDTVPAINQCKNNRKDSINAITHRT